MIDPVRQAPAQLVIYKRFIRPNGKVPAFK